MDEGKFQLYTRAYKGTRVKQSCENEQYRSARRYNFAVELVEILDMLWLILLRFYYHMLSPIRNLHLSLDRIISKIAFCPPYDTYVFDFNSSTNDAKGEQSESTGRLILAKTFRCLDQKSALIYAQRLPRLLQLIECFYTYNSYGNRIACLYMPSTVRNASCKTIVYSHTNAEDLGTIQLYLWRMRRRLGCHIFAYDYSGFGISSGCPSERNLYEDAKAAVEEICRRKSLCSQDLILFGESIGSVPTIYLASQLPVAGVILQSALSSGIRVYMPYHGPTWSIDPFANVERVSSINSPTLVIHGTDDRLVDISHAVALFRALPNPVSPFWVTGASHMNIPRYHYYYDRVRYFINFEINKS